MVEIDTFDTLGTQRRNLGVLDVDDRITLADDIAFCHRDLAHDAIVFGLDDMFHFHGFYHRDLLTFGHFVANAHVD